MLSAQSSQVSDDKLYVDDVFSTYLYTGNGSTQTITNGIDLAGKGGLVWLKGRSSALGHGLFDTTRGIGASLISNTTAAASASGANDLTAFNSSGFSVKAPGYNVEVNNNAVTYASWTFRKAPKFFDVVTYTGNGAAGRQIPHSLGITPGMVIVKQTNTSGNPWLVSHRSLANDNYLELNTTVASAGNDAFFPTATYPHTSNHFCVGSVAAVNGNGSTYVAYLFAHDTSTDGIIQCGSFTTDGSGNATVNLGWEPQFGIIKTSSTVFDWYMMDSMRGMPVEGSSLGQLFPNTSGAEISGTRGMHPTATGFVATGFTTSTTFVYLAILRPNKPPTTGTQVYNAIARTGTGAAATVTGVGFAPDLVLPIKRSAPLNYVFDRLRGPLSLVSTHLTNAESSLANSLTSFDMDGCSVGTGSGVNQVSNPFINHFFKRAPGFMDIVCYPGNTNANVAKTVLHSLGVIPELIITKARTHPYTWSTYAAPLGNTKYLGLNSNGAAQVYTMWNNTSPTTSVFTIGNPSVVNDPTGEHVAYLFATKSGISKVGTYTGNNGTQTIPCGFTTGARFILIKRTDSTGDWFVWDTARGIIEGNDNHLSLNTTAAEVTTNDSIDPDTSGFKVNQVAATNINVNLATYIFLAIS